MLTDANEKKNSIPEKLPIGRKSKDGKTQTILK